MRSLLLGVLLGVPASAAAALHAERAAASTLCALKQGHLRVQVNLHQGSSPTATSCEACSALVDALGEAGFERSGLHLFFDSVRAATAWRGARQGTPDLRTDVLGLGSVEEGDSALILVTPTNTARVRRRHRQPTTPEANEPDALKLEAVQELVVTARERPVILVNPDLEAMLVAPRLSRPGGVSPVRPMFLGDFVHAYFLAEATGDLRLENGDVAAVRRAYPRDWEIFVRGSACPRDWPETRPRAQGAGGARGSERRGGSTLRRSTSKQKPAAADVLRSRVLRCQNRVAPLF